MPRLSLWREDKANDYKFIDRRISEMFTIGGTGILVHKYLGPDTSANDGTDATKPDYINQSALNIQDLLFVENRDRKYDTSVYKTRGIYQRQDQDFSLSQFGIFLAEGTLFMSFHLNDIVELLGRRLISGDVLELMHLKDDWGIDESVPNSLKRFYVVGDTSFASEGFSPTWYPHLWRAKLSPMVDSQEYKDILNKISASSDPFAANTTPSLVSIVSTYEKYKSINEAVIAQAEIELPRSGYDTENLFTVSQQTAKGQLGKHGTVNGNLVTAGGLTVVSLIVTADTLHSNRIPVNQANLAIPGAVVTAGNIYANANVTVITTIGQFGLLLSSNVTVVHNEVLTLSSPALGAPGVTATSTPPTKIQGYMTGDGTGPNGSSVNMGISFPGSAQPGDYFLRLDYVPNRLFRFDGKRWVKIEDAVRTDLTPGASDNHTLRSSFVNDTNTFTDLEGRTHPERQSLSKALTPKADN